MLQALSDAYWGFCAWLRDLPGWRWRRQVRRAGLFPAYADWVGVFAVDRERTVWFSPHLADWSRAERVIEPELQHAARAQASRRGLFRSWLAPERPNDAVVCPTCTGRGRPTHLPARLSYWVICECGGLGWVPPGWWSNHTSGGRWAQHGLDQPGA